MPIINHPASDAQLRFWRSDKRFRAFVGGIGSGKTRAGCVEVLRQPAGTRGAIVAPTYPMLRDSTLASFTDLARVFGILDEDAFNKSTMTMTLRNGTEILWRSCDDPDHLRGPNLGWFWLDEGALMPEEVFDIMIGRLREQPGRGWITTTPKGFNWLHRVFQSDRRPDYSLFHCSTDGNPFLTPEFVESLRDKYEGAWARQEFEGEFVEWVDTPAYTFSRPVNLVPGLRKQYRIDLPLVVCCDFNVRFMSWPVLQVIKGHPMVLTEITTVRNATIEAQVKRLRDAFAAHPAEVIFYGDAAGHNRTAQTAQSDYDLIRLGMRGYSAPVDFRVPMSNPAPRDRINAVNRLLRGADQAPMLKIDAEECPELIADLLQVEWDKTGTRELQITDPKDERANRTHSSSGLGYWAWREYPVAGELYQVVKPITPLRAGKLLGAA